MDYVVIIEKGDSSYGVYAPDLPGDHRHFGGKESVYSFTTPDALLAAFERDIARWNREDSDA